MTRQTPVMRICISCRKTYDRKNLIKITKDHKQGIMFQKGNGAISLHLQVKKMLLRFQDQKKASKSFKNIFRT